MHITSILFDADGVIQRSPAFDGRIREAFGHPPHDLDTCVADIFAAELPTLVGGLDYAEALPRVFAKWNASCDSATFLRIWHTIFPDPSIVELVRSLRDGGYYCALASNQERHRALHMSEKLGYAHLFHDEFYSYELGHAKPSVAYFQAILGRTGLDSGRTLFIDDREDNVMAARSVGITAIEFELPASELGASHLKKLLCEAGVDLPPTTPAPDMPDIFGRRSQSRQCPKVLSK